MEQKAKMQIGDMLLDGVIDIEPATSPDPDIREAWNKLKAQLTQSFRFTLNFNMPEEGTPGIIPDVVEGSIIEPITDPTKLLGEENNERISQNPNNL